MASVGVHILCKIQCKAGDHCCSDHDPHTRQSAGLLLGSHKLFGLHRVESDIDFIAYLISLPFSRRNTRRLAYRFNSYPELKHRLVSVRLVALVIGILRTFDINYLRYGRFCAALLFLIAEKNDKKPDQAHDPRHYEQNTLDTHNKSPL